MSGLLAHAISAARQGPAPAGFRGLPLRAVAHADLLMWATAWPDEGHALEREDALRHHELVSALCLEETCLPVRFGTWLPDEDAARARLRADELKLRGALDRVRGRAELAITLLWTGKPPRPEPPSAPRDGRGYLEARRAEMVAVEARRRSAEEAALRLRDGLSVEQADAWHEICPGERVAASLSLLVPADRAGSLKNEAARLSAGLAGMRAVVSGPWPPYTFVARS